MRIPMNDLARNQRANSAAINNAVQRVVQSGYYISGPELGAFEKEFSTYNRVAHAIGVANGTDALELALRVLNLGRDHQVAIVANAGFYSSAAINSIGATPVYIDVEADSHLMNLKELEKAINTQRLDAIVITHLYGRLHDMDAIKGLADSSNIPIIEDCAQAHGACRGGKFAGSFGSIGCFSFYPTKNLGALGDGGALVTNDVKIAQNLNRLKQYGWDSKYRVNLFGGRNSRLDEIQAAILRAKLPLLDQWNERRRQIAKTYSAHISHRYVVCPEISSDHVAHLYVIRVNSRQSLMNHLENCEIGFDVHFPIPDHRQPAQRLDHNISLPVTEALAEQVLTLPCFPEMTDSEVETVVAAVNSWKE